MKIYSELFSLRSWKFVLGLLLGISSFLVFYLLFYSKPLALGFFFVFLLSGSLKIRHGSPMLCHVVYAAWAGLIIAGLVFFSYFEILFDCMFDQLRTYSSAKNIGLNCLLVVCFMTVIFVITARFRFSVIFTSFVFSILTFINGFVFRFRGNEFVFADIFSVNTALNVAAQYDMTIRGYTWLSFFCIAFLILTLFCFPVPQHRNNKARRIYALLPCVVMIGIFAAGTKEMKPFTWNWDGTSTNGFYVNFYLSVRNYFVEKPSSYSPEYIEELEQRYASAPQDTAEEPESSPNILIIMNESFADFRVFGNDVQTNTQVLPFYDSLTENTIKGYALSSVYGGSTANSEFECLTGFSMQFLPAGTMPYQQYIQSDLYSLVQVMNQYGYQSMATHPFKASGWNRTNAYPRLGFSASTFMEDYPGEKLLRDFISDQEMYEYVLDQVQNCEEGPLFLLGITMQNHGSYDDYPETSAPIHLEGYSQEYTQTETYLTLLRQSDMALEYFLGELEKSPEKTVVLFFGDHLPSLDSAFYEELYGKPFDTLDSRMLQYTVPFFIWANYDIPEQTVDCTSLAYLSRYLLETAGLPLPPYFQFLKDLEQAIPAINALGYYSNSAQAFLTVEEAQGTEAQWLQTYSALQYNGLFEDQRSNIFFGIE